MMTTKNASSDAMAKPCLPLTVAVPAAFIDDTAETLGNVLDILREEMTVRVGSISANGRIMGPDDDEMASDDLRAVAEVAAAYCAVCDLVDEFDGIKRSAQPTTGIRRTIADITTQFRVDLPHPTRLSVHMGEHASTLKALRLREQASLALKQGDKLRSLQLHIKAFLINGRLDVDLVEPDAGEDPEADASAKLAKRDAARNRGSRK